MTRYTTSRWLTRTFAMAATLLLLPGLAPLAFGGDPPISDQPITGDPAPGLEGFDQAMVDLMQQYGFPGAVLAVVREGADGTMRVVLEHGYGYWDRGNQISMVTQPSTRFRIASISKGLTAVAILKLIQQGKLTLDTKVSEVLPEFQNPASGDPGIPKITIRNLLEHTAGWDNTLIGFDPMYFAVHRGLVQAPGTAQAIINYMLTRQLNHVPGTTYSYSNFGYCVLGRVIEKLSGSYSAYVGEQITGPLQMNSTALGGTLATDRLPSESLYYDYPGDPPIPSVLPPYLPVPWPYGGFYMPANDASGGWVSTTSDLLRFVVQMNTGQHSVIPVPTPLQPPEPFYEFPPDTLPGYFWNWYKTGSHPGSYGGVRLFQAAVGGRRTYWCFLTNSRPADDASLDSDFDTALQNALKQAEQAGQFSGELADRGQPLWR